MMNLLRSVFRRRRPAAGGSHVGVGHLALGALGVVYGDIGTSPLYALKECFNGPYAVPVNHDNVMGILSLVFWSITFVVSFKYLTVLMRADNKGEGGIVALMAMLLQKSAVGRRSVSVGAVILLGLFGAALLYGDGIITPAISVLSAVEGLELATPIFHSYVVPITLGILVMLFMAQRSGTSRVGLIFGPSMIVWFFAIAAIAIPWIIREPRVVFAVNPLFAARFFVQHSFHGFLVLGAVVLCVTGGEALYADMGHFGARPIRLAWYAIVYPALIINYFGQGALLLANAGDLKITGNPFFGLVPRELLYPMVGIATVAAVIASQALISGAFSLTSQAIQLGFLPRLSIIHTSEHTEGQIFVPRVNSFIMIACLALVLLFRESSALASAYGIAVTGTMTITSILFYAVARQVWNWSTLSAGLLTGLFLVVDLAFMGANLAKLGHGGFVPIAIAALIFTLMTTWYRGRAVLSQAMISRSMPLADFINRIDREKPHRVQGTAVFMTPNMDIAPNVMLHHYRHNHVLHERIVLLTIVTKKVPYVKFEEHGRLTDLSNGFSKIVAKYGFMERPNVIDMLSCGGISPEDLKNGEVSFYLGRETLLLSGTSHLAHWRKRLFAFMSRNAQSATAFFRVPPDHVIELGSQLEI